MNRRAPVAAALLAAVLAVAALPGCSTPPAAPPTFEPEASEPGVWSRLPDSPLSPRRTPVGAWVDGRFLLIGGLTGPPCPPNADCIPSEDPPLRDGAAFDPATGDWQLIADAPVPISGHNVAVVDDTLYLLAGEPWRSDSPPRLFAYEPDNGVWLLLPTPPGLFPNLLDAGGTLVAISPSDEFGPTTDSVFDPVRGEWLPLPDDPLGPSFDRQAVWMDDGSLLLAAKDLVESPGSERPAVVRLARLSGDLRSWTTLPDTELIGWGAIAAAGMLVFPEYGTADGGEVNNWGRDYALGGILDPEEGTAIPLPTPPTRDGLPGVALTVGDSVLVGGHLLDPRTLAWTLVPTVPGPDRLEETIVGGDDAILLWGGSTPTDNLDDGYLLRLSD